MDMAAWTHNMNVNRLGYDNKAIKKIVERHTMMMRKFQETEYSMKVKKALEVQTRKFNNRRYQEGDSVFYQKEDKKSWNGPVKVIAHRGNSVFVMANGNIKKVADY